VSHPAADAGDVRIESLEAELREVREALRASQAELCELRSSLAFRGAHALSRRFHSMVPAGTRRARGVARGRAVLRFFFRWRLGFASRAAREELRGLLHGLRPAAPAAPELRHVHPATVAPVFDLGEWDGAPILREAEVEGLLKGLWAATRAEGSARPS
jgi:hypothetical protein